MENSDFFNELEQAIKKIGFGVTSLTLQVHDGSVVNVLGQNFKQVRYPEGQNSLAIGYLLAEVKKLCDNHKSGSLSFSLDLEKGNIRKLEIQENISRKYEIGLDKPR
jgi:hypothetical protein